MWYLSRSSSQSINILNILHCFCGQELMRFLFTASCGALLPTPSPLKAIPGKDGVGFVHKWPHRWPHHEATQPAEAHGTVHDCKCWDPTVNLPIHRHLATWHNITLGLICKSLPKWKFDMQNITVLESVECEFTSSFSSITCISSMAIS